MGGANISRCNGGLLLVRELDERLGAGGTVWDEILCFVGLKWMYIFNRRKAKSLIPDQKYSGLYRDGNRFTSNRTSIIQKVILLSVCRYRESDFEQRLSANRI